LYPVYRGIGVVGYSHTALQMCRPAPGLTHLCVVHWILGSLSLGIRQAVCEVGHSLPSSTPLLLYNFMICVEKTFTGKGLGESQSQCLTLQ
jgi:hypothetical protein